MKLGSFRTTVASFNANADVFSFGLGILHEDIEVAVIIEDTGVE